MQLIGVLPFGLTARYVKSPDNWPLAKKVLYRVQDETSFVAKVFRGGYSNLGLILKTQILTGPDDLP